MQKNKIYLSKDRSGLAFFSADLVEFFGGNVGSELVVRLRGKGPHEVDFAYDIVRPQSVMKYTDLKK